MTLKSFVKTGLISALLFFVLVFLGMKYHWIEFFKGEDDKNLALVIPDQPTPPENTNNGVEEVTESEFQPKIIHSQGTSSLIEVMTQLQVEDNCRQLYQEEADESLLELLIGNCVLSNFNDPYQEVSSSEKVAISNNNRQKQTQKKNAMNACLQSVDQMAYNNEIERQLLMGICVSEF